MLSFLKRIINGNSSNQISSNDLLSNHIDNSYALYADCINRFKNVTCIENGKIKLHFGCGPRILKGWINIDLIYEPYDNYLKYYTNKYYPEEIRGTKDDFYQIDVTKVGIPLPDNSVDLIFHEDFIEHLNQMETIIFLAESYRVLKKGCVHHINTPDLTWSMKSFSDFSKGFPGIYIDEWLKHGHKNMLTSDYLEELALMIGYSEIEFTKRNCSISKDIPLEYRPANDRSENGNLFVDLIK